MSWRAIPMKFPGTCLVCKQKIEVNEVALWAKGLGVKHQKCAQVNELKCAICGTSAGCLQCEFADDCNREKVSQLCICKKCYGEKDAFVLYQKTILKRFPILNIKT
ncbi:MAG TPA: hypothetical protein VEJ68_01520 [Candidatus Bathyarchaeia archaeon]|nr:hypothetical protein [Candidatus Bathyarchaeia archaeon]